MNLKTINYRGGIAVFSIPETWIEEYEPSGGATFYEDAPDTGTLRLNVLSFESPETSEEIISNLIERSGYTSFRDNMAIRRELELTTESDETLAIRTWSIAILVLPNRIRIAIFSYTLLESQLNLHSFQAEITLLEECIGRAQFSCEPGLAGDWNSE